MESVKFDKDVEGGVYLVENNKIVVNTHEYYRMLIYNKNDLKKVS